MPDMRTETQKAIDTRIGMPLYYCSECMREVKVTPVQGAEPIIKRPCTDCCNAQIYAPRRAIVTGRGGMTAKTRAKILLMQLLAMLTGRCV